jgi:hypothetical protein
MHQPLILALVPALSLTWTHSATVEKRIKVHLLTSSEPVIQKLKEWRHQLRYGWMQQWTSLVRGCLY